VVNLTKDAIWIREASIPDSANTARPDPKWMVQERFGGVVPKEIAFPPPAHTVAEVQEQAIRDLEIKPETFTPPDQIRPWVREWPVGLKVDPARQQKNNAAQPSAARTKSAGYAVQKSGAKGLFARTLTNACNGGSSRFHALLRRSVSIVHRRNDEPEGLRHADHWYSDWGQR